jgi:hypothetical protein
MQLKDVSIHLKYNGIMLKMKLALKNPLSVKEHGIYMILVTTHTHEIQAKEELEPTEPIEIAQEG